MKKFLTTVLFSALFLFIQAQSTGTAAGSIGENSNMKSALGTISLDPFAVYDIDGNKKGFNYVDIGGSPFLFDDWRQANIYDDNLKKIASVKVRFNTYSNQIHFLDSKEQELIADKGSIKKIEILKNTNNEVELVLEKGFSSPKTSLTIDQFVQVLNEGHTQLIKQITNKIVEKDSLVGTVKVLKFSSSSFYFLETGVKCEPLKRIDQAEIFGLLTKKDVIESFEKNNKQKLRKEKDAIEFLNYYNSQNH